MNIPDKKTALIVPCYNVEDFIDSCLDSVVRQDSRDFFCVIVNDGSTDKTAEHIEKYCAAYPELFIGITIENSGPSVARNTAIDMVIPHCEYIAFLDGDDYISENYISTLVSSAEKYGSDLVWGFHSVFRGDEEPFKLKNGAETHPIFKERPITDVNAFTCEVLCNRLQSYSWAKLFKVSLFDGVRFPEGRIYEDTATIYRLVYKAKLISATDSFESIYFYRINPNGIVLSKTKKRAWQIYIADREQYDFCLGNNMACADAVYCFTVSNALATVHCRMRGNDVPDDVFDRAVEELRELPYKKVFSLDVPAGRKMLFILCKMNLKLYMKAMKRFV